MYGAVYVLCRRGGTGGGAAGSVGGAEQLVEVLAGHRVTHALTPAGGIGHGAREIAQSRLARFRRGGGWRGRVRRSWLARVGARHRRISTSTARPSTTVVRDLECPVWSPVAWPRSAGRSGNTRVYVLDRELRPVPPGSPGSCTSPGPGWPAATWAGRVDRAAVHGLPVRPAGRADVRTGDLVRWTRRRAAGVPGPHR